MRWNRCQLSVIQQALCVSALFGVVCQLSLFIFPYTSENKQARAGSLSGCVLFPATLLYGWGYTQFVCCLLGSKTRRVSSQGRDLREHLPMRMLYFERVLLRGSLHQHSSRCQPCFHRGRPATALMGIADKTTPVPATLDATPVFIRGGGCGGCRWAFEKHIVCTSTLFAQPYYEWFHYDHHVWGAGWLCFAPLHFVLLPPGMLRGVCPCQWSHGPVPLLLRHGSDWEHGDLSMDLADGLETGSPYLHLYSPDLVVSGLPGLMVAAPNVVTFGLLYMRSREWWLKTKGFSLRGNPLRMLKVMRSCLRAVDMWRKPWFLSQGLGLGASCRRVH